VLRKVSFLTLLHKQMDEKNPHANGLTSKGRLGMIFNDPRNAD
jgi:hypothetical protein